MSEKKWEEKIAEIVKTTVTEALKTQKTTENPPSSRETTTKEHKHWEAEDLESSDCPECKKELEKVGKDYMKKVLIERKDNPLECDNCGTRVKEEEKECPTCGNKGADSRS